MSSMSSMSSMGSMINMGTMSSMSSKKGGSGIRSGIAATATGYGNARGGSRRKRRKQRGGYSGHLPLSPHSYNSAKDGGSTSGVDLQFVAGSAG